MNDQQPGYHFAGFPVSDCENKEREQAGQEVVKSTVGGRGRERGRGRGAGSLLMTFQIKVGHPPR